MKHSKSTYDLHWQDAVCFFSTFLQTRLFSCSFLFGRMNNPHNVILKISSVRSQPKFELLFWSLMKILPWTDLKVCTVMFPTCCNCNVVQTARCLLWLFFYQISSVLKSRNDSQNISSMTSHILKFSSYQKVICQRF